MTAAARLSARDEAQAWFEDLLRRANAKDKKGSFHIRQHQALAEMYAEAILPLTPDDDAHKAPRKLVEGVALACRLGRKKDGREPWAERRKKPEEIYRRVAEAFEAAETLRAVLEERATTRAYLQYFSQEAFAVAQARFHTGTCPTPPPATDDDLPPAATLFCPPGQIVVHIRDDEVDAMRHLLAMPETDTKVFITTRRSIEKLDIRRAVRFFEACGAGREAALTNLGQVILLVDGYNDDARELWQIRRVRRFFTLLWQAVPHLLFFLKPEGPPDNFGSVMFLAALLQPPPQITNAAAADSQLYIDREWLAMHFLTPGFAAMNAFAARHGLRPSDAPMRSLVKRISQEITRRPAPSEKPQPLLLDLPTGGPH